MTKEGVKNFVKEHKKGIILGSLVLIGGSVIYGISRKLPKIAKVTDDGDELVWISNYFTVTKKGFENCKDLLGDIDFDLGDSVKEVTQFDKIVNTITQDITVGDLAKLGEDLLKIDGVTKDNKISAAINIIDVGLSE